MGLAIEVSHVDQEFRMGFWMKRVKVLRNVSLAVPERSIFGFLGANGAGKTTLISLIVGIRRPTSGSVRVFGLDAASIKARSRVGYLPERPYFHEHLTGEGLLRFYGTLGGMTRREILDRIPVVLSSVGMTEARKVELKKYSKGMLQRIGMAQALIHDPEFLVLDEPMSGLDPLGRKEMREIILSLAAEGRTIFFSSHVIPDVEAICNKVGLIRKGEIVDSGPIEKFLASTSSQIEIGFRSAKTQKEMEWSEWVSLQEMPHGMKAVVSGQQALDRSLQRLIDQKANILWVTPIRQSLEEFFVKGSEKGSN